MKFLFRCVLMMILFSASGKALDTFSCERVSEMEKIIEILRERNIDLSKTAVIFDFDETLFTSHGSHNEGTYKFLPCPDRARTYKGVFETALENSGHSFEFLNYFFPSTDITYHPLDPDIKEVIETLKNERSSIAVCSARSFSDERKYALKTIGLQDAPCFENKNGLFLGVNEFLEKSWSSQQFSTVILVDNSRFYSLEPFLKNVKIPNCEIVGIEYTRFTDNLTENALKEEIQQLPVIPTVSNNPTPILKLPPLLKRK